jgi:hypothetical protein
MVTPNVLVVVCMTTSHNHGRLQLNGTLVSGPTLRTRGNFGRQLCETIVLPQCVQLGLDELRHNKRPSLYNTYAYYRLQPMVFTDDCVGYVVAANCCSSGANGNRCCRIANPQTV